MDKHPFIMSWLVQFETRKAELGGFIWWEKDYASAEQRTWQYVRESFPLYTSIQVTGRAMSDATIECIVKYAAER